MDEFEDAPTVCRYLPRPASEDLDGFLEDCDSLWEPNMGSAWSLEVIISRCRVKWSGRPRSRETYCHDSRLRGYRYRIDRTDGLRGSPPDTRVCHRLKPGVGRLPTDIACHKTPEAGVWSGDSLGRLLTRKMADRLNRNNPRMKSTG